MYIPNFYLQEDKPAKAAPLRFSSTTTTTTTPTPPVKSVVSEDYYYYDDPGSAPGSAPGSNNAPLTPTFQNDYHDYEYYDIDNDEGDFKKRALQFKKFLRGVTSPMGTEGKLKYININVHSGL